MTETDSMKTMLKLLPYPLYSPVLASSEYYLFADYKKMLQKKRFIANEEVISATESKDKTFYKNDNESLEK